MPNEPPSRSSREGDASSARREEALERFIDRLNTGEAVDPEEIQRDYPEMAEDIISQLEVFAGFGAGREAVSAFGSLGNLGTLGDYTLRRQIGRGGMGVVYEAWENSMDRRVALKVLPAGIAADSKACMRFLREAQTAGKLNHPHVVGVYSTGVKEGTPWYSMEFVEGETLAQILLRIKEAKPEAETPFGFPRDDVAYYSTIARCFADVADGLQYAHSKGVIHRDIKPSNLILDREGHLRILDFGLARMEGQESLTLTGDFVGTPLYMSPEQARRKKIPVDHRTDIYSLGATLYEMLTLRPPIQGKDHQDTLSQIIERDPAEPRKLNPRVPKDLETIVLKCLRKDAADRYGTAEALGQDLRRFVRNDPIEARPLAGWERIVRRARRSWRKAALLAMGCLLLASISILGVVFWTHSKEVTLERYRDLVESALDRLEIGVLTTAGQPREGETLSLGLVLPYEVGTMERFLDDAAGRLERAVDLLPARPEAFVGLYRAYRGLAQDEEAARVLRRALDLSEDFVPGLIFQAHALRETDRSTPLDKILQTLRRRLTGGWQQSWLDAHRAALEGHLDEADKLFTELLRDRKGNPPFVGFEKELRLKRGRIAFRRGQSQRALRDFSVVAENSVDSVGPKILLAVAYYEANDRAEAERVLDELIQKDSIDEAVQAAIDVFLAYGEKLKAQHAVQFIRDPDLGREARLRVAVSQGMAEGAAAADDGLKALQEGCKSPWFYGALGEALLMARRGEEGREILERAYRALPHQAIFGQLRRTLYYLCDYNELIARCGNDVQSRHFLGCALYRQGKLGEAIAKLLEAAEGMPRHAPNLQMLTDCYDALGDTEHAVATFIRQAALDPGVFSGRWIRRRYSSATRRYYDPFWDDIGSICAAALRRDIAPVRYLGFQALSCLYKREPERDLSLELAQQSVLKAGTSPWTAEALGYLGEVHAGRGEREEAVRVLEQAVALPVCYRSSAEDLASLRKGLFPLLASCASVDAYLRGDFGEGPMDQADCMKVLAALDSTSRVDQYINACLLEVECRWEEARQLLEDLVDVGGEMETALILRLARLRSRAGNQEGALTLIEDRCLKQSPLLFQAWAGWMAIATSAPALESPSLLERLKNLGGGRPGDVAWVLTSLRDEGALRINCGGSDYLDSKGRKWWSDRFYMGGWAYGWCQPPIPTSDRLIYYDHRFFRSGEFQEQGYRIPLPIGHYEIVLYFCEVSPWPHPQRFGIIVEGSQVRDRIEPVAQHGFAVPFEERIEIEVNDGDLEISFSPINYVVEVNAIEVRRVGPRFDSSTDQK